MHKAGWMGLALFFLVMTGCGVVRTLVGLDPDTGEVISQPGQSPIEQIGSVLGSLGVPIAGLIGSVIGWIGQGIAKKKYVDFTVTAVELFNEGKRMADEDGKVDYKRLLEVLAAKQDKAGVRDMARKMAKSDEAK